MSFVSPQFRKIIKSELYYIDTDTFFNTHQNRRSSVNVLQKIYKNCFMYQLSKILKTKKYIYLTRVGLGGKILK